MKTCNFKYSGSPRTNRVETVYGKVTLTDEGKTSISLFNAKYNSYAANYAAKNLAHQIVKADFNHPAVEDFREVKTSLGLVALLKNETADFKNEYILKTKAAARRMFDNYVKDNQRTEAEWLEAYNVKDSEKYCTRKYYAMKQDINNTHDVVKGGFEKFEASEIMYAERHYETSIQKLAFRLISKGIVEDEKLEVISARLNQNFEVTITSGNLVVRAWTIIAEGPVQRAHYRYLIK